jgi:hypothetical protein
MTSSQKFVEIRIELLIWQCSSSEPALIRAGLHRYRGRVFVHRSHFESLVLFCNTILVP